MLHLNGHSAITDGNGEFYFKSVKPGTYHLLIDRTTTGLREIPDIPMPIRVEITGKEEAYINFSLVESGSLKGKLGIRRQNGNTKGKLIESIETKTKLPRLILEMRNGNETIRRITDDKGNFEFDKLRPGEWILKLYSNGLPEDLLFEQEDYVIDVKPGSKINMPINVIRKQINIKFKNSGIKLRE
mgnify:CR=1 FL=1